MFGRSIVCGLAFSLVLLSASPALAQRGGGRGGFGGGPPGGDFRARILERIDTNGNGVIEPDEAQGRAQGFIQRMAQEAGLDPRGPLRIDRLVGGSGGRDRGDRGDSRRDSRGDDRRSSERGSSGRSSSGSSGQADPYPAVNPFGDESVPGFGISPLTLDGKIIDLEKKYDRRVLDYVNRIMEQYDKNKTGILERNEWAAVSWRSDPRESDLDNDGMLTKAEMAERLANRSRDRERGDDRRGGGDDRRGPPQSFGRGGGPSGGGPPGGFRRGGDDSERGDDRGRGRGGRGGRGGFDPTEMIRRWDQNGDGVIQPDEIDERRRQFMADRMGIDFSRPVPVEEIGRRIQERMREREEGRSRERERRNEQEEEVKEDSYRVTGAERLKNRMSYRSTVPALPDGLPSWWDRDANQDGQVTLAEYIGNERGRTFDAFSDLDMNRDGVVTAQEAHAAAPEPADEE
jgi:hypothetical protein